MVRPRHRPVAHVKEDSNDGISDASFCLSGSDNDGCETDLTEPSDQPVPPSKTSQRRRCPVNLASSTPLDSGTETTSSSGIICQPNYDDPSNDTDENLSDVPSDFGGSVGTKALRHRIENRWRR
ncbi:hypothetical protein LOZ58_006700, partial [Ophidiomyces ophidiicola]